MLLGQSLKSYLIFLTLFTSFSKLQHLHFQNDTSAQRQIPEHIR